MIEIKFDEMGFSTLLQNMTKQTQRACERALDATADDVAEAIARQLPVVFDRPTLYTKKSLWAYKTKGHNMIAGVMFKEPDRMTQHYLIPEVEGSKRHLKGFERHGMGGEAFIPGKGAKLDQYGNVSAGQIRQIMSVLGRAEHSAGYMANMTARSTKTNKQTRDYVYLPNGAGALPPGIYQRTATAKKISAKAKSHWKKPQREYQRGSNAFGIAVRARGLKPLLVKTTRLFYKPRLPFYGISQQVSAANFKGHFFDFLQG